MRTILLLALLLPLFSRAQNFEPRALRPSEIDPYTIYVFQWCKGVYTTVGGECAAIAYFTIKDTGEWVRFPIACDDCQRWSKGMELNLEVPPTRRDSIQ